MKSLHLFVGLSVACAIGCTPAETGQDKQTDETIESSPLTAGQTADYKDYANAIDCYKKSLKFDFLQKTLREVGGGNLDEPVAPKFLRVVLREGNEAGIPKGNTLKDLEAINRQINLDYAAVSDREDLIKIATDAESCLSRLEFAE